MKESAFWKMVKEHLPLVHWQRIESGSTGRGVPDVNGCFQGAEFWVELKVTTTNKVGLRPEQVAWHLLRTNAGGKTFIFVKTAKEIYLFAGRNARDVADLGLKAEAIGKYTGTFQDWCHIFWVFTGCHCAEEENGKTNTKT